jgi:hypothetical protein
MVSGHRASFPVSRAAPCGGLASVARPAGPGNGVLPPPGRLQPRAPRRGQRTGLRPCPPHPYPTDLHPSGSHNAGSSAYSAICSCGRLPGSPLCLVRVPEVRPGDASQQAGGRPRPASTLAPSPPLPATTLKLTAP